MFNTGRSVDQDQILNLIRLDTEKAERHLLFRLLGECLLFCEFSSYAIDLLFEVFDRGGERCVLLQPLQEFELLRR